MSGMIEALATDGPHPDHAAIAFLGCGVGYARVSRSSGSRATRVWNWREEGPLTVQHLTIARQLLDGHVWGQFGHHAESAGKFGLKDFHAERDLGRASPQVSRGGAANEQTAVHRPSPPVKRGCARRFREWEAGHSMTVLALAGGSRPANSHPAAAARVARR